MSGHKQNLSNLNIENYQTLFLDRDGVINKKIDNEYVRNWEMFEFLPGAVDAIRELSQYFSRVIIVSNQQGIGKGLMTTEELKTVHQKMISHIEKGGGRIDMIYFAPMLAEEKHPWRKPGTGMAIEAKKDFPEIDFSRSIMIGDSESDMLFGGSMGMTTVLIKEIATDDTKANYICTSLLEFCKIVLNESK